MAWVESRGKGYRLVARIENDPSGKTPKRHLNVVMDERLLSLSPKQLKKELQQMADRFENEINSSNVYEVHKLTIKDLAKIWMEDYVIPNLQRKTVFEYESYLRRILGSLGHLKITELRPKMITDFYKMLSTDGIRRDTKYILKCDYIDECKKHRTEILENTGIHAETMLNIIKGNTTTFQVADKISRCVGLTINNLFDSAGGKGGLDAKTIRHHHRVLTAMFNKCIKWQLINSNPAIHAEVPFVEQKEAKVYNIKQAIQMFSLLANEPLKYQAAVYVALFGGLRLGEIVGLDWDSLDFESKTVSVIKSRQYISKQGSFDKLPKTRRSVRKLTLSDDAMYILEEHKKDQDKERKKLGDQWVESGKIFTQSNGTPMFPTAPSSWFAKWLKRVGLPKITFHELRHTHASILIHKKVDIASIAKRLGHTNIKTTLSIYAHAFEEADSEIANLLDDVLSPRPEQKTLFKVIS
jgi:integrase